VGSQVVASLLTLLAVIPSLRGGEVPTLIVPWPAPIGDIVFKLDALGAFFLSWSLPLTAAGTLYAMGYLAPYFREGRNGGPHFALLNMICVSFVMVYTVQHALVFLLGWEIAAVSAWLLVIWDYKSQKIRFAGFNYLVSTHVGFFALIAAFMLLHSRTDSMDFTAFGAFLAKRGPMSGTLFLLFAIAFALKSAFFPFHTWLPRAHAAAPAHVSALMSGVIHKAGLFAFLRFTLLAGRPDEWMGWSVLVFGALSAFFGVMYTTVQRDLKRLLGYSSTENVGIAAMGFGVGYLGWTWNIPALTVAGFGGGLLHILNHAIFKCLLFYAAGAIHRKTHTVDIERLGGLARNMPRTAMVFLVGSLAISALPPLNGFVSEMLIYSGLLSGKATTNQGNLVLIAAAAMLAFVGAISALSMTRAFGLVFLGRPRQDLGSELEATPRGSMGGTMVVLAALVVVLGVLPELGLNLVRAPLSLFQSERNAMLVTPIEPFVWPNRVLALALVAVSVFVYVRGKNARRSATWGCGYTASTPRMQYTGGSFSAELARIFVAVLPSQRRARLPDGPFPASPGRLETHHTDAVEQRMFEVLDQGESFIGHASEKVPEEPRFAFAAGVIVVVILGAIAMGATR
jgi:hydrogenase-4 component B